MTVPRVRGGRRGRQILSAHDPEMRHGRQTSARRFTGYKLHAAAASEAPILTAVSLSAGNEHDGQQAGALVDQQAQQRRPKRVIGDTAYGNVEAREELERRSISVLAPVHSSSPKQGTIAKEGVRDRPPARHGHLSPRQESADLQVETASAERHAQAESAEGGRRSRRPLRAQRLRALSAPSAVRARRPAGDQDQPPRGPAPSRAAGVIRSRRARPSQAHQAANRAAARTHRLPVPRA